MNDLTNSNIKSFSAEMLREKIRDLRVKHRALDVGIIELEEKAYSCNLTIRRLKKEKLQIKDALRRLESELIPNLNA